ncbi:hypothetical protein D9756_000132 [Leucocoprinus leucothites]|uniref:BTB domain-containing protein n=1 Tax=Leucocoprinus leucothites TaxID=201217 RepID=A0A8H5GEZ5_9AGAR|nr:hypothetical protein D9756_000132 [Leucoagaricus leucothites]
MAIEQRIPERPTVSCEFDSEDADLILLSRDPPTEFHVHSTILAAASPFFHDMFTLPQGPSAESGCIKANKPVVPVTESRDVLATLLQFVYPTPDPEVPSLEEIPPVLDAAIKYDLTGAIVALRRLLTSPDHLQQSPIQVYAIACRFELEEDAQTASAHTLRYSLLDGPLCEDLKYISAWQYHRLLELHRTRSKHAQEIIIAENCPTEVKCMQCNSSLYTSHGQPKWYYQWESEAKLELAARPISDTIFSIDFLGKAAKKAGCARCSESIFQSWPWLMEMKQKIDELPRTV